MSTESSGQKRFDDEMTATQLEKLRFEIKKIQVEVENLTSSNKWENRITRYIPVLTILIAVTSFWFGIYQFRQQQNFEIQRLRDDFQGKRDISEKEFRREFYKKQMEIFFDISKTAAQISTIENPDETQKLHQHFLELINGNLGVVQNRQVMDAANQFKEAFNRKDSRDKLQSATRDLSTACKNALKDIWQIPNSVFE